MKVFITGGSGFIGSRLVGTLMDKGHQPIVLTRSPERAVKKLPSGVELVGGDPSAGGVWQSKVSKAHRVVNLVGESIFGRWTKEKKEKIIASRVEATERIVEAIPGKPPEGFTLLSGSAVGFYGFHGEEALSEKDGPGSDFLSGVAVRWEEAARKAEEKGVRVITLRTGIVLGPGGALRQMVRPFRMFAGGPLGSGRQYISWIHIDDEVGLILFALENRAVRGPLNATSPNPVSNAHFSKSLGRALNRPSWMPVPSFAIRAALGEFAGAVLNGQRALPEKALSAGYNFLYPDLDGALASAISAL